MTETVDARGLACPQPVILTRRAMRGSTEVVTIVDNETSLRNVTRMAEKQGYRVEAQEREDGTYLHLVRQESAPAAGASAVGHGGPEALLPRPGELLGRAIPAEGPLVLLVASEFLGRGEHDELGSVLMRAFFHSLGESDRLPDSIYFLNSGVKLVLEGSPVLEDLRALRGKGTEVYACGTCLDYYGAKDRVRVGEVTNMYSIAEALLSAGRVVNL